MTAVVTCDKCGKTVPNDDNRFKHIKFIVDEYVATSERVGAEADWCMVCCTEFGPQLRSFALWLTTTKS